MKKILLVAAISISALSYGQTVNLNLAHEYDGVPFSYGTTYMHESGIAISLDRVQYYMSSFELTHDGGQQTAVSDSYVLASANISNYTIGDATVSTIEAVNFDLGIDYATNHMGTSMWDPSHVLSPQTPLMDWGWPSGYFFLVIDGMLDNTGDGIPNQPFSLRNIGDVLLRNVDLTSLSISGNTIAMSVNVADWLKSVEIINVFSEHGEGPNNVLLSDNTNDETVFTITSGVASSEELQAVKNTIHADYSMPYAPTLYYTFNTKQQVSVNVYDMNGALVLEDHDLNSEGNYFIRKELMTGSYIAIFSNNEIEERYRFVVQR